jgi:hypothetical protein
MQRATCIAYIYQSLQAGDSSADLERDPGGDPEYCLGDLPRAGDPSLSGGGDLLWAQNHSQSF